MQQGLTGTRNPPRLVAGISGIMGGQPGLDFLKSGPVNIGIVTVTVTDFPLATGQTPRMDLAGGIVGGAAAPIDKRPSIGRIFEDVENRRDTGRFPDDLLEAVMPGQQQVMVIEIRQYLTP